MPARLIPDDPFDSLLELVFRHKGKILLLPLLVLSAALLVILYYPRTYVSEARVLVQVGRESVGIDPTASTGAMISLQQTGRDDEMTSAVDVLESRAVLSQVVERLGTESLLKGTAAGDQAMLAHPLVQTAKSWIADARGLIKSIDKVSEHEEAIQKLSRALNIRVERGSTVMQWRAEADSPQLAQAILNEMVQVFQAEHMRIHRNQQSKQFFVSQLKKLEDDLMQAQRNLRDKKNEIGVGAIADRRSTLESQLREIEVATYTAKQDLTRTVASMNELVSQTEAIPARDVGDKRRMPNSGADQLNAQLYALKVERLDLVSRFTEEHPRVRAITRQIAEAQDVVDAEDATREEVVDRVNPVHEALLLQLSQHQSSRAGIEALLETLAGQRESVVTALTELNHAEVEIDELTRYVTIAEKQFYRFADDFEQARIDAELEEQRISNIAVVQPATLIEKPVKPSKTIVALGALLLAVGGTVMAVVASEKMDQSIRSPAVAESILGVPVMATLPLESRMGRLVG